MLISKGPYAVIVTDLDMPGMNGMTLLAKVSVEAPRTAQVVLTGKNDMQTFADTVEGKDVFRYLAKLRGAKSVSSPCRICPV
jgi:DNA-binding NtrC family response regulator